MGRVGLVEPIAPGHAIAIAELVDVRRVIPLADDVEAWVDDLDPERHFAWVLRRVRPTKPFRVRGRLGLYDVDVRHSRASAAA